jgi:phenylpropionate dioxygenase-like ring-hydroxylating dioxygenase large terminal subunit
MAITQVSEPIEVDYRDLVHDDGVASRVYADPQIFQEELERIWYREWIYLGHESEVRGRGDFVTRNVGREPVIVVRGEDNAVRAFANRCRHRGATVCQADRGSTTTFRCDYHGWTYGCSGELMGVPYPTAYGDSFSKQDLGLVPLARLESYRGFVFGSLSPEGMDLAQHLGPAADAFDLWCEASPTGRLVLESGVSKYRFRGNWKLVVENAADGYHPLFLHRSINGDTGLEAFRAVFDKPEFGSFYDLGHGHSRAEIVIPGAGSDDAPELPPPPRVSAEAWDAYLTALTARHGTRVAALTAILRHTAEARAFFVYPNLWMLDGEVRIIQPISAGMTTITRYPTTLEGAPHEVNSARWKNSELYHGPAGGGDADDVEIWERSQRTFEARLDDRSMLRRGLDRERSDNGTRVGQLTDDTGIRGTWRHYLGLMTRP